MKILTTEMSAHLSQEVTSLATCWKLSRKDGTVQGFTDHDDDISLSGVLYLSSSGFTPSAISSSSQLNVDNLDVEGVLDSNIISKDDLLSGLYDHAEIQIFQVNYNAPDAGTIILRTGWIGEVSVSQDRFIAEVRGLSQRLSQNIGEIFSPTCRANFADSLCGLDENNYKSTGSITSVISNSEFLDSTRSENAGIFTHGVVKFTSGNNIGQFFEVKTSNISEIKLMLPATNDIMVGDNYEIIEGCDKRFETCVNRFDNAINFRGEPHVPGIDRLLETSSTRS